LVGLGAAASGGAALGKGTREGSNKGEQGMQGRGAQRVSVGG
jgi:hypothetical protein